MTREYFWLGILFLLLVGMLTTGCQMPSQDGGAGTSSPADAPAEEAPSPEPVRVLFENVNIFDGISKQLREQMSVLVEGNLIQSIARRIENSPGATVIDGGGRTLMPGLIDSHAHLNLTGLFQRIEDAQGAGWDEIGAMSAANARDYLLDGYTTVRDACGMGTGLKKLVDREILVGPRIYSSGACLSQTSGHGDMRMTSQRFPHAPPSSLERLGIIEIADGAEEVLAASRRNLSHGAAFLKLMSGGGVSSELDPLWTIQYTVEEIRAAVIAAEQVGTYVACHAYHPAGIRNCLEAGGKSLEHAQLIDEPTMQLLVEKGVFLSLNTAGLAPILFQHPNFASGPSRQKLEEMHEGARDLVRLVKEYEPKVVHNVDTVLSTFAQGRARRDFEKYQFASLFGNMTLLRSMTSTGGELAALTGKRNPYPGKLGVIEEGALADIIVVDGNPVEDIAVLGADPRWFDARPRGEGIETIRLIMKDGKIYKNTL